MFPDRIHLRGLLAGLVTVCAVSSAAASARAYCQDSSIKLGLIAVTCISQWLVIGFATGFAARLHGFYHGLLLGLFGSLLTSALWILIIWGRRDFGIQLYWFTLSIFIVYAVPGAALAGYVGGVLRKRFEAQPPGTTKHQIVSGGNL